MMVFVALAAGVSALTLAPSSSEGELGRANPAVALSTMMQAETSEPQAAFLSGDEMKYDAATEAEIREWLGFIFRTTDKNSSGFIEVNEAPRTFPIQEAMGQIIVTGDSAQEAFIEKYDRDSDGLISEVEFVESSFPAFRDRGIPKLPEGFKRAN